MVYTLGKAAKATGKSKATISKAIKSGKISAEKQNNGSYKIEPSELHRVDEPVSETIENERLETPKKNDVNTEQLIKIKELELRLEVASEKLEDKENQLDDVRQDRDKWRQQATALLENKAETRSLWAKIFGKP